MSQRLFLLDPDVCEKREPFRDATPAISTLRTMTQVKKALMEMSEALWVVLHTDFLLDCVVNAALTPRKQRLLVLEPVERSRREVLRGLFRVVIFSNKPWRLLPPAELAEAIAAENAVDLVIGGVVDKESGVVRLIRGNLDSFVVPVSAFPSVAKDQEPDMSAFALIDYGQTIRLGDYEASVDALLYEYDRDYRRRQKAHWHVQDKTFGGCLRRLRLQKGLRRVHFPGISAKEIARIERGEIQRPHTATIRKIAQRLSVKPAEILEF